MEKQGNGIDFEDIKTYFKATIIKTIWHWLNNK